MKTVSEPDEIGHFSKLLLNHMETFATEHDLDTPSFMAIITDAFAALSGGVLAFSNVPPAKAIPGIRRTMSITRELATIAYLKAYDSTVEPKEETTANVDH